MRIALSLFLTLVVLVQVKTNGGIGGPTANSYFVPMPPQNELWPSLDNLDLPASSRSSINPAYLSNFLFVVVDES